MYYYEWWNVTWSNNQSTKIDLYFYLLGTDNKRDQRSPQFGFLNEGFSNPILSRPGYPEPIVYPAQGSASESFAESSAESISTNGGLSIEESQANAQSASFNFGPYSASFNVAESSSGSQSF